MLVMFVCAEAAVAVIDTFPRFVMVAEPVTSPAKAISGSFTLKSMSPVSS